MDGSYFGIGEDVEQPQEQPVRQYRIRIDEDEKVLRRHCRPAVARLARTPAGEHCAPGSTRDFCTLVLRGVVRDDDVADVILAC